MTLTCLQSFRATCDEPECKAYINISLLPDLGQLVEGLWKHKWLLVFANPTRVWCPEHAKEKRPYCV